MALSAIGVVSSIPAPGTTPGTGTAAAALKVTNGNAVRITGKFTAGTGSIFLLRWEADLGEWRPWRSSQAVTITGSEVGSFFDAIWAQERSSSNWFLLYAPGTLSGVVAHVETATY